MFTQCPECLTIYRLRADALAAARARVRCGTCGVEFDSLLTLADELPAEPFLTLKRRPGSAPLPQLTVATARPPSRQRELFTPVTTAQAGDELPSFVRETDRVVAEKKPPRSLGWALGCVVLLMVLAGQMAYARREALLARPEVRAFAAAACERLDCVLPALADPSRIVLLARDVRPHPSVAQALIISATLSNQADFAQPYPVIEITLSNVDEKRIALRRFAPAEYVGDPTTIGRGLPAGGTASLSLEVQDPGNNAVAFEFRFLRPSPDRSRTPVLPQG